MEKATHKKPDLPERIVAAALELLTSRASHAITYREIAAAAGVSHMAPYRYFKTKEDILARIAETGFTQLNRSLQRALEAYPIEPEKQLSRAGVLYFEFARRQPATFRLMFLESPVPRAGASRTSLHQAARATFAVFRSIIHNCQMTGALPAKQDAEELAFDLWSYVHGATLLHLFRRAEVVQSPRDPRRAIARGLAALIRGLRAGAPTLH